MSLDDWVTIAWRTAFCVLIVVRLWRWHLERKVKAEKQKLAIEGIQRQPEARANQGAITP